MSLEPNGCFGISKMKKDKLYATRPVSLLKATLKPKVWTMVRHMPPLSSHILLAYANHHDITLYQMNIKSAFLNGEIEEEVYVK